MRKFLRKVSILFLLVLLIAFILDFIFTQTFQQGNTFKTQWLEQIKNEQFDYVLMGSSRAYWNIDCQEINERTQKKGISLADNNFYPSDILIRFKRFLENNNQTKKVLLQIDYNSFANLWASNASYDFLPFLSDKTTYQHFKYFGMEWELYRWIPFYRYVKFNYKWGTEEFIVTKLKARNRLFDEWGNHFFEHEILPEESHEINQEVFDDNFFLNEIFEICKKNKIELICFTAPYYHLKMSTLGEQNFKTKIDALKLNHENFTRIYDQNPNYFAGNIHLSETGGKAFTDLLIEKIFTQ